MNKKTIIIIAVVGVIALTLMSFGSRSKDTKKPPNPEPLPGTPGAAGSLLDAAFAGVRAVGNFITGQQRRYSELDAQILNDYIYKDWAKPGTSGSFIFFPGQGPRDKGWRTVLDRGMTREELETWAHNRMAVAVQFFSPGGQAWANKPDVKQRVKDRYLKAVQYVYDYAVWALNNFDAYQAYQNPYFMIYPSESNKGAQSSWLNKEP